LLGHKSEFELAVVKYARFAIGISFPSVILLDFTFTILQHKIVVVTTFTFLAHVTSSVT